MYFLHKGHHNLLALRNTSQHFSTILGGHLKQWSHQQKAQDVKNMTPNRLWKGCLFLVWELKQEGRALPSLTSVENICMWWLKFFATLCMYLSDHKSATDTDFEVTDFSEWANAYIQNLNNEDRLYICTCSDVCFCVLWFYSLCSIKTCILHITF